jgi:5-methylcytosine-specific restriction protein B
MNTADRSVEALDTALRRRFEFSEIEPNWDVFDLRDYDGVNVGKMMRTINQRIEHLIDRDHCIGQSYFYQVDDFPSLQEVFSKNILPLLKEYFFGDFGKVGLILGAAFVHVRSERHTSFASFDHPDADLLQEKVVYDLQDPTDVEAGGYHAIYS